MTYMRIRLTEIRLRYHMPHIVPKRLSVYFASVAKPNATYLPAVTAAERVSGILFE